MMRLLGAGKDPGEAAAEDLEAFLQIDADPPAVSAMLERVQAALGGKSLRGRGATGGSDRDS